VTAKTGCIDRRYGYAGQFGYVYDKETGYYFLQSRYYDPGIGRFTTKDRFTGLEDRPQTY
jgi:RHS repeat-associated protein